MNLISKVFSAAALATVATGASAAPFYIDLTGTGIGSVADPTGTAVNATSTSLKDEMTLKYQSSTAIDFGGDGILNAGDSIVTTGGLAAGNVSENVITSLNPGQVLGGGFFDNGYGTNWILSFGFDNLAGTVNGFTSGFPTLDYDSGTIHMYISTDGTTFTNFMDLIVEDSFLQGGANLQVVGAVSFTGIANSFTGMFHDEDGVSFYDTWLANGTNSLSLNFAIDQNTNPQAPGTTITPTANGQIITSNHDGSITFSSVPEPASLALLGIGLMGYSISSSRKKQIKS